MLIIQELPLVVLKQLLRKFDLGVVKKVQPLATSGNISYIINTSGKKYLFRLSPFGFRWRSKQEIGAELEIINFLLKKKIPTPRPIITRGGEQIISWKNHHGYLREFIDAKPKLNPTLREIKQFGKLLGRFHNLVKNYETEHKRKHIWNLEETKKNFRQDEKLILKGDKGDFEQRKEFIKKYKKEIFSLNFPKNFPSGTIHEDLGKRHVLWQKDKIVGIIDFDRSYYGNLILDLGQACRGWCFTNNWRKWDNERFQTLLDGYQSKRRLSSLEKNFLVDAIKFGILERGLSFYLRFVTTTHDYEDKEYARYSISESGLLGMVEKNREKIEEFL